ncbi:D-aminoacyl-tRNA deacylase [Haloarchaeobius sp. TZWWS8]|uniref:D-aminoacyl-tRNA deacylase n=1 Tax=Haloarchaeobius sp. TZWWS8 TaxID=3446121 RepID=UPI003EB768E4
MIAIVVSRADSASEHVGEHLLHLADWETSEDERRPDGEGGGTVYRSTGFELREFDDLHLDLDDVAAAFDDPDMLVFASRHAGDTGALLTAHFTGNFGPAEYGGEDDALAEACPNAQKALVGAFDRHAPGSYDVGMECTHHGPSSVGVPSMFVELGSGEEQWTDPAGAEAVARAILDIEGVDPHRERTVVGFGGNHYVPRFERVVRETEWAVGHIAADWGIDAMGHPAEHRDVLRQAFENSGAEHALVDGDHPVLCEELESLGYRVVSETWLREVDGRDLGLVAELESAICPVEEGLRFGDAGDEPTKDELEVGDGAWSVRELPKELLDAAQGIDRERVLGLASAHTVAYETVQNGTRVEGRAAVSEAGFDALVDGLVGLLEEKYDSVTREEDAVVATTSAFDPARAAEIGVPEGPSFGRLANGESVDVDGRTVTPEDVSTERVDRFVL